MPSGTKAFTLLESELSIPVQARMLRLRVKPASPQDGLPGGALRLDGRFALQASPFVALGRQDGNGGEWNESVRNASHFSFIQLQVGSPH